MAALAPIAAFAAPVVKTATAIGTVASAAKSVTGIFGGGGKGGGGGAPTPPAAPPVPTPVQSQDQAQDTIRRKKLSGTRSIYTNPLGVAGEAAVARKTLLGA